MSVGSTAALAAAAGVLLAGAAAAAPPAPSEGPGSAEQGFTPRAAAEEALRANPELSAAREAIAAARGRLVQVAPWPNPELGLAGASDFAFANQGERSASVALEQRFPIAGRLAHARDVASIDVELALAEARDFERGLIGDAQWEVFSLLALDRAIESRDAVIAAAREIVRTSARRREAAEVSETDLNLLEIELASFEQERELLALERRDREIELSRLLYRSPDRPLQVAGALGAQAFSPGPGPDLLAAALRDRPDLHRARLSQKRSRAEGSLARAEAWEDWRVEAGYQREETLIDDRGLDLRDRDDLLAGAVRIPLPLWNRNQGRIAAAAAGERRAGFEVAALERRIEAELEAARRRIVSLESVARNYRERLVPRAERNVGLLRRGYAQGLAPISALVQAQRQLAEASASYARALGDLRRAEIDLETSAAASPILEVRP